MGTNFQMRMPIVRISALLAMLAQSPVLFAQTVAKPQTAKPRTLANAPDLSGVWEETLGTEGWNASDPAGLKTEDGTPYLPEALALTKAHSSGHGSNASDVSNTDAVVLNCDPPGIPRLALYPHPLRIIQTPDEVLILYEATKMWREIYLDGRALPNNLDPTWFGYSVGRYEAGTLVVETAGERADTWLDNVGRPHSDALHIVERYSRPEAHTLRLDVAFNDPKMYAKPWTGRKTWRLSPPGAKGDLQESICAISDQLHFEEQVVNPATNGRAR